MSWRVVWNLPFSPFFCHTFWIAHFKMNYLLFLFLKCHYPSWALGLEPQHQYAVQNDVPEQNSGNHVRSEVFSSCLAEDNIWHPNHHSLAKASVYFPSFANLPPEQARLQVTQWASNLSSSCFEALFLFLWGVFSLLPYQLCITDLIS